MTHTREGWAWPDRARVQHYFRGPWSLCGRWQYGGNLYPLEYIGPLAAVCAACRRKAAK